ncbi:hypothetical protein BpHYR1_047635 [Brachionus plicatilis]|uniref:Uncharacterized protein n=1 Tax=Brachionus plicatilis TaxID=10195 RepID=A0A3M7PH44_BRAPC|nr:hypothetical protein BpHYR1_047635 [Brachionus plicatilis]
MIISSLVVIGEYNKIRIKYLEVKFYLKNYHLFITLKTIFLAVNFVLNFDKKAMTLINGKKDKIRAFQHFFKVINVFYVVINVVLNGTTMTF